MVKLYTTESINRNVTKASFLIFFKFVLAEIPKTHYSYCNYGVVGVTCGNTPSQKHSLVLVSKLFMLVLLKSCANLSQEVFILVELNKLTNFEIDTTPYFTARRNPQMSTLTNTNIFWFDST